MLSTPDSPRDIAILGAGRIGGTLARLWLQAGHTITLGSRDPERHAELVSAYAPQATAGSLTDAAAAADVVVLSVPYHAVEEVVGTLGDRLADKVVIDTTNPFGISADGRMVSTLEPGVTAGTRMAHLLARSRVVRAFTHIVHEVLETRAFFEPVRFATAIAGDDPEAKTIVASLIHDAGFTAVDLGPLSDSQPLDPGGILFPQLLTAADMRALMSMRGTPTPSPWAQSKDE